MQRMAAFKGWRFTILIADMFKFNRKGALIDTNLLVLYTVSMLGAKEVEKCKRTSEYSAEDVEVLKNLIQQFRFLCTTPHVITEASNLLHSSFNKKQQADVMAYLANYVSVVKEHREPSIQLIAESCYARYGITDTALCSIAKSKKLILITADLPLYGYAASQGIEAVNFNYLRNY